MRFSPVVVLIRVAMTLAIGLLASTGWPGSVISAVLGLSLRVMLFCGSYATPRRDSPSARAFAVAAAITVALGYVLFRLSGDNPAMWGPAVILAGVMTPASTYATSKSPRSR